jgi:hypothetical protein
MGLGLLFPRLRGLCAFAAVRDRPTATLLNSILSHLAISQETWVRNGRLNLAYGHYWFFFMLNLRHGTDGFTSPPKEVVLRIFITLKNPSTSVGIEPANLGSTEGDVAAVYPVKSRIIWADSVKRIKS